MLAAATSLTLRKFERLSTTLLGLMFLPVVCILYRPSALRHPSRGPMRSEISHLLRGAWALAGLYSRAASPHQSKWMILFARFVGDCRDLLWACNIFFIPSSRPACPWKRRCRRGFRFRLSGVSCGRRSAAEFCGCEQEIPCRCETSIGGLMSPVLPLSVSCGVNPCRGAPEVNGGLIMVAENLIALGAALALASALPRDSGTAETVAGTAIQNMALRAGIGRRAVVRRDQLQI